jgi:hypothetical protein
MISLRKLALGAIIAGLLVGCSSHTSQPSIPAQAAPSSSASVSATPSPTHVALDPCTAPQPAGDPVAITPRTDGIYMGIETGNHPVAVRYYPNHEVYYGVGRTDASAGEMSGWLNKAYSSANGNITGPWSYDSTGAFNKPNTKGQLNKFTVWKYTGTHLNLHIVSTFGCKPGTVREETIFMTFTADTKH